MLGNLERKLAAIVADGVAARTHLSVGVAPMDPPAPGAGTVAVDLSDLAADLVFAPGRIDIGGPPAAPKSHAVLPLKFKAGLSFTLSPQAATPAALGDARALMLDDMAAVAHLLATPDIRSGAGFAIATPDPGFQVGAFGLVDGTVQPTLATGHFAGHLAYAGRATVWPPDVQSDEGVIAAVDPAVVPLPLAMRVADGGVRPGGTTTVTVAAPQVRRLTNAATGARAAPQLAVAVLSDAPPGQRGTVPSGVAGNETGLRIVDVAGPTLSVAYAAPAGNPGPAGRTEYLAVHLATTGGGRGVFLGSVAIRLLGS